LTAPDGTILSACEQVAVRDGRALLRSTLSVLGDGTIRLMMNPRLKQTGALWQPVSKLGAF
jgi:hypothetical protein